MKTFKPLLWFFIIVAILISCQKEKSFEKGFVALSSGSLKSAVTGDCLGNLVSGIYKKDTSLNSSNYVDVQIDVTNPGSFLVTSDTVNGFYFKATGSFTSIGVDTVRLQAYGTPTATGTNIFTVTYDSTQCTFSVPTVDATGGTAGYTLAGAPAACTGATVQGTYTVGVAASSSNTATVQVDVSSVGTYTISTTPVDGISFSASGTFTTTGTQPVVLSANGTPVSAGPVNIPVSAGASNCSFQVTVAAGSPAVYTLNGAPSNCTGATVQGTYVVGTALTSSNTATIQVNVTTPGTYSITTTAANGITFAGSGVFSTAGVQSVVLVGSGTPAAAGPTVVPVSAGGSNCSFSLTVVPVDYFPRTTNSNWSYEFDGNPADTLFQQVISPTISALGNTYNVFMGNNGSTTDTTGYFRRSGGDYSQYLNVGAFFQLDQPVWGEYIFLKDNVAVNTTWTSSAFSGTFTDTTGTFPIMVRFKETLQQKDVPVTVQGITYQNTIVVKEEYEYSTDGGSTWTALPFFGVSYFARNVGLIKLQFTDNSGGNGSYLQELTRSQIF